MFRSPLLWCTLVGLTIHSSALAETPPGFVIKWGATGSAHGQLNAPFQMACDENDNVYVVDTNNRRVEVFTPTGTYVRTFNVVSEPRAIAARGGYVYIADAGADEIFKFTTSGSFVTSWGSSGAGNGQFNYPSGIAVDASGDVYVSDANNFRIQKFTGTGVFLSKWGSNGSGNGQFNGPWGLTVDPSGFVYAVDRENHRIQKFAADGTFVTTWGFCCSGDGSLNGPYGISSDNSGNIYVADYSHQRVQKFTGNGAFLTKWGTYGSGDGEFKYPAGVCVDSDGNVYVADGENDRIQKFDPDVAPLPPPPPNCDDEPKIMVHVTNPASKNVCNPGVPPSLDQAVVKGTTATASGPFYFVYLVAIRGSVPEIAGLQCGVTYENNESGSVSNGSGVDVFAWNRCATLEFPEAAWPAPGSGNTITWDYINNCQTGDVAVAGYFYVGAYTADTFRVIPKPANARATVATCSPVVEIELAQSDMGYVAFSPGAAMAGCNPCLADCAAENPIPVEATTWGRIKSAFPR